MAKKTSGAPAPTGTAADNIVDSTTDSTPKGTEMATEPTSEGATESTALVPAAQTAAPESTMAKNKALAARLPPQYQEDVLFMIRPTPDQLFAIVEGLSEEGQMKMMELVRKTRPKKQGQHMTNEGFTPTQIRTNQGTGNDQAKPPKHPPGNFYTADSRDMGDEIQGVVLGIFEGRTMWPPRDQGDSGSKGPICYSYDRKMGSKYGDCATCPNAAKKYTEGGCTREVTAYVMDREMTGIYEIKFSKSSVGGGEGLGRVLKTANNLWERWFTFKSEVRTEGDRRWYVTSAKPFVDPKKPEDTNTSLALHPLFEGLSRLLDADVYYPQLAEVYSRAAGSSDAGGAVNSGADVSKLLGNTASDSPDYSNDNPNV